MQLLRHHGPLAICRLPPDAAVPDWASDPGAPLTAVIRSTAELSLVTPEAVVPDGVTAQRGWIGLAVEGPLDFTLTGVLAALAVPLADAGVPIFVLSTFDTDWILVRRHDLDAATRALVQAGHSVRDHPR